MARPRPVLDVEVAVSFRRRAGHLDCAYILVWETRTDGQRSCLLSRHVAARDERLVDLCNRQFRELVLEHVLVDVEPF
jgi:hypothetical protein